MLTIPSSRAPCLASLLVGLLLCCAGQLIAAEQESDRPVGTISGRVSDKDTQTPVAGATVEIRELNLRTAADSAGRFSFPDVTVGQLVVHVHSIGYEPVTRTGVVIRPGTVTLVEIELVVTPIATDGVLVTGSYFSGREWATVSTVEFPSEEVQRSPGSLNDVNRAMATLPGVSRFDDHYNALVVRGGSPLENGIFVDNIGLPNINHFPSPGSSAGAIGLIRSNLVRKVVFYSGGFPVTYGDRLSSVMDISLREGNRLELDGQVGLSLVSLDATLEGPLGHDRGSWLVAARRGFLELVLDVAGADVAPKFEDYAAKVVYDLGRGSQLEALGIMGRGDVVFSQQEARGAGFDYYGDMEYATGTWGINWRHIWGRTGLSNTSVAYTRTRFLYRNATTEVGRPLHNNSSVERSVRLRNVNLLRLSRPAEVEFGLEVEHLLNDYNYVFNPFLDFFGHTTPQLEVVRSDKPAKLASFVSCQLDLPMALSVAGGIRLDHFSLNRRTHLAPRLSIACELSSRLRLQLFTGLYYQALPLSILSQHESNTWLRTPRAVHVVASLNYLPAPHTRLSIEIFDKEYDRFPMDSSQPSLFIIDEFIYLYGFFLGHDPLVDNGRAFCRGAELTVLRRLTGKLRATASASYARSRYKGLDGIWRDRIADYRVATNLEVGYSPGKTWDLALRWSYAGGLPYTPADSGTSARRDGYVFDQARVNAARSPAYHVLDIRVERRFLFRGSSLRVFLDLLNAYNRQNVAGYQWDEEERRPKPAKQIGVLPVVGIEYEF